MFKTTPTNPLYNMMGIPHISFLLPKLMHAYTLRLQSMPLHTLIRTVLTDDRCHYWPSHVSPTTNLTCIIIIIFSLFPFSPYSPPLFHHMTMGYLTNTHLPYMDR